MLDLARNTKPQQNFLESMIIIRNVTNQLTFAKKIETDHNKIDKKTIDIEQVIINDKHKQNQRLTLNLSIDVMKINIENECST